MAQFARPNSDTSVGGWYESAGLSQTNIYTAIDEVTRADGDYIYSSPDGSTVATCKIALSSVFDPEMATGHIVRYTYLRSKTNKNMTLVVRLLDTGGTIATWTHTNPSDTFTLAEQTLSETQANNISSYSTLALEFEVTVAQPGGGHIEVSWAEFEIPTLVRHAIYITHT